jgi:hypothetical protein
MEKIDKISNVNEKISYLNQLLEGYVQTKNKEGIYDFCSYGIY